MLYTPMIANIIVSKKKNINVVIVKTKLYFIFALIELYGFLVIKSTIN